MHINGSQYEYIFDENEKRVSMTETHPNGSFNETTYYANGNRKMQVITFRDGRTEMWYYTEDGTTGTATAISGTVKETYHSNGRTATYSFTTFPAAGLNFTYEEYIYDENGTITVFTYPDGGGHTEYWYGNNLLGGIVSNGKG